MNFRNVFAYLEIMYLRNWKFEKIFYLSFTYLFCRKSFILVRKRVKIVLKEKDWKHILRNVSETDGFRKIVHIVSISEHIFFYVKHSRYRFCWFTIRKNIAASIQNVGNKFLVSLYTVSRIIYFDKEIFHKFLVIYYLHYKKVYRYTGYST